MLQDEGLIFEFLPIDGLGVSAFIACEETTLAHESWSNYGKGGTLITKSFLSRTQSLKVFCCLWNCLKIAGR